MSLFKKILVANRGEIACRVLRTARRLGIQTVAVYSEADKDALHVELADEAVCIGPPPAAESYLDIGRMVAAAKDRGAEAVHPGYGFLSENPAFARKLARAGLALIGPPARAIAAMGDKIAAKALARRAGVSTIPGPLAAVKDAAEAVRIARRIGYPVMLKAAAGGGGKGMRIAAGDTELGNGFRSASREAKASFGDERVFVEKYIPNPRHVEIQILGDRFGTLLHLGERECTIQRRHQKVIEESPSPFVDESMRRAMGAQAVALARAVGYVSAGTVEFVVDEERNFYFLEMNTRLQVEHPVTEMVTGLDLVEAMIRIAAGERLSLRQEDVRFAGWSVEARIYAEDPLRNFLPSVGRLERYAPPPEDENVRIDTGVFEGGEITIHYDPMIAKVVTKGRDRNQAIQRLRGALDAFIIRGVCHNIGFLAALAGHPRFIAGHLSTHFIAEEYPRGFHAADVPHDDPALLAAVAACATLVHGEREAAISGRLNGPARPLPHDWAVVLGERTFAVRLERAQGAFEVDVGGARYTIHSDWSVGEPLFRARVNGEPVCLQIERVGAVFRLAHSGLETEALVLASQAEPYLAHIPRKVRRTAARFLLSPMPGLLQSVAIAVGQQVKAGEELAVVEAMKMENVLRAERDATVKAICAKPGDTLVVDQPIVEFE